MNQITESEDSWHSAIKKPQIPKLLCVNLPANETDRIAGGGMDCYSSAIGCQLFDNKQVFLLHGGEDEQTVPICSGVNRPLDRCDSDAGSARSLRQPLGRRKARPRNQKGAAQRGGADGAAAFIIPCPPASCITDKNFRSSISSGIAGGFSGRVKRIAPALAIFHSITALLTRKLLWYVIGVDWSGYPSQVPVRSATDAPFC